MFNSLLLYYQRYKVQCELAIALRSQFQIPFCDKHFSSLYFWLSDDYSISRTQVMSSYFLVYESDKVFDWIRSCLPFGKMYDNKITVRRPVIDYFPGAQFAMGSHIRFHLIIIFIWKCQKPFSSRRLILFYFSAELPPNWCYILNIEILYRNGV